MAKRGRPRKTQISDDKVNQVAKRGRPRKTQISDDKVNQVAKRGRPRKTRISDDKVKQVAKRGRPCKTQISDSQVKQVAKRGRPRKTQISDNNVNQVAKRGRPRKTQISDNNVNQVAKRGRPRKTQISDNNVNQVAKRGRPRKTQISDNNVNQVAKRGRPRNTQISDNNVNQMANGGRPRKTEISADKVKQTAKRGRPRKTPISMNSTFTQNSENPQQSASVSSTLNGRSDLSDPCSAMINAEEPAMIQDQTELNNQVTNPPKTDKDKISKSARRDVFKSETTNQPQCSSHSLPTLEVECLGQAESEGEPGSGFELVSSTSKSSLSQSGSVVNLAETSTGVRPGLSQPLQSQGSIHEVQSTQGNLPPVAIPEPSQPLAQAAEVNPSGSVENSQSRFKKERTPTRGASGQIKLKKRKSVENQGPPGKVRSTDVGSQSSDTKGGLVTSSNKSDSVSCPECPECHLRHAKICHKKMTYLEKLAASQPKREVLEKAKNQTTQSENGKAQPSKPSLLVPKRKLHFGSLSSPSSSTIKYLFMKKSSTYSGALSVTPSWLGGPSTTPPRSEEPTNTPTILGEPTTTPSISGEPTTTPSILGEPTTTPSILGEPTTTPPRSGEPTTTPSILGEPSTTPPILGEPSTTPPRSGEPTNTLTILGEPTTTLSILGEPTNTLTISGEPSTTPPRSGEPTNTPSRSGETSAPPTILGELTTTPSILGELTTTLSILGELTTTPSRSGEPSAPPTTPGQPSATLSSLREPFATPSRSREPAGTQLWLPATPPRSGESSTQPRFGEPSCTPPWSGGPSCTQENSSVPSSHNVLCSPGELVSQDPSLVLLSSQSSSGTSGYFSSPCDSSGGLVSQLPCSPKRESDSPLQSDEDSSCELQHYYEKSFGSIKHELLEDYDPPSPLY